MENQFTVNPDGSKSLVVPGTVRPVGAQPAPETVVQPPVAAPVQQPAAIEPQAQPQQQSTSPEWGKIQEALSQGYSRQEVNQYLQKTYNMDEQSADQQLVDSVFQKVKDAKNGGYSNDEIRDYLSKNQYDNTLVEDALKKTKMQKRFSYEPGQVQTDANTELERATDIADLYRNIYGKWSTTGKELYGVLDENSGREARIEINQLNSAIVDKLNQQGLNAFLDPQTGEAMITNEQGINEEVDSGLLNSLWNSKGETAGAIAGGIAGAKVGLRAPVPFAFRPVTGFIGGVAGSAVGAATGKALDITVSAMKLKESLDTKIYYTQMADAGIADATLGVLGATLFKAGAKGAKGVMKAWDFVANGNTNGAYKALLDNLSLTDEQATELVTQWERIAQAPAPGRNAKEKAIAVVTATQQGAESFVGTAAAKDPKMANLVISEIDERAKSLYHAADQITDNNTGKALKDQLDMYTKDVKKHFGEVRQIGGDAIDGTDYRFALEPLAIDPVMQRIQQSISNPVMKERFVSYANRIAMASSDRSFSGLLNLRQAVNDFKYSKSGLNPADLEALNGVLNKIDGQVSKAVKQYMPDTGKVWLEQFKKSKESYAKMKQLENNVLFKLINRKGITDETIQKALGRYVDALDGTFDEVMDKLPPAMRAKAEAAIIKQRADMYVIGNATDKQAIHFPMLARDLASINIKTPEGKRLAEAVTEMSKVFRNDLALSRISGNVSLPRTQTALTADLLTKVKFEVATSVWGYIKATIPGKTSGNLALIKKTAFLLEQPMNAKNIDSMLKDIPQESRAEFISLVKELQVEMIKAGEKAGKQDFVNMYKQSATGKLTKSKGALGEGVYLVDKVANPSATSQVIKQEVNMSRMATIKDISELVGREVSEKEIKDIPELQKQLVDKGFLGIRVEGKAMLFPETTAKK